LDDVPDETTILNFHWLPEKYDLARKLFNRVNAHLSRKGQSLCGGTIVAPRSLPRPVQPRTAGPACGRRWSIRFG
jgi:IS5 family transposase